METPLRVSGEEGISHQQRVSSAGSVEDAVAECASAIIRCRMASHQSEHDGFFSSVMGRFIKGSMEAYVNACRLWDDHHVDAATVRAASAMENAKAIAGELDAFNHAKGVALEDGKCSAIALERIAFYHQAVGVMREAKAKCRELAMSLPGKFDEDALYESPEYAEWQKTQEAATEAFRAIPPDSHRPIPFWNE